MPFTPFFWEGSPAKIDYRNKGTLVQTSLLEDLEVFCCFLVALVAGFPCNPLNVKLLAGDLRTDQF